MKNRWVREEEEEDVDSYGMLLRKRGHWKLEEETLDRVVWRSCFGRVYGTFVRQTAL